MDIQKYDYGRSLVVSDVAKKIISDLENKIVDYSRSSNVEEQNKSIREYLKILQNNYFGITQFLPETYRETIQYNKETVQPGWFRPH